MSEEMSLDLACANAIRALAMDAVQQANSGHPGAPMGMADMAERLWRHHLKHNPQNPDWVNRDRFVLSNGHGSMLIYSLLHLTGYDVSMDDLKAFRQLGSSTPGHPEYGDTPGVETTTGPLGQGLANAVGMALAEKILDQTFNATDSSGHVHTVVDHHTYVFAGDGCLMEGISHEACSLAGTWQLGKLICFYDDNGISIDGEVKDWFTDDTPARFRAYGWQVIEAVDGHDSAAIEAAIAAAKANENQPTLICCKTRIGFGSPNKEGTAASHGSPLGVDEIAATRQRLSWEPGPFEIPEAVYNAWDAKSEGAAQEGAWNEAFAAYEAALPELAAEFKRRLAGQLPDTWDAFAKQALASAQAAATSKATRQSSGDFIAELSEQLPELIGGSADLSGSNSTIWAAAAPVTGAGNGGNYIYYGVREFAMTAIASGLALHGGLIPFTGTFLMFMEYARNAVRMSSLMGVGAIHVYTHDSIGQGEDGPTHQPIEQLTNLRTTPNLCVWRPCDAVEVRAAWCHAISRRRAPTALVLSRQSVAHQARSDEQVALIHRGGYVLFDHGDSPEVILLATGSEVDLARTAADALAAEGRSVRVVSMPCAEVFAAQDEEYQEQVLPRSVRKRLAIEAGHGDYWRKWVGLDGDVVSIDSFGASGKGGDVMAHFGFSHENVLERAARLLEEDA